VDEHGVYQKKGGPYQKSLVVYTGNSVVIIIFITLKEETGNMHIEYFTKSGWKNFLLSAIMWYTGITVFIMITFSEFSFVYRFLYYAKYTWPSFLLCYTLIIWIIPRFLLTKRYVLLFISNILTLAGYITLRYYNNNYFEQNPYIVFRNSEYQPGNLFDIIAIELNLGIVFTFISYGYRFFFDWVIIEQKSRKLENEKLKADLAMLRYQLNPHFLFNTINNIYYLAIIKSEKTANALLKLSELLRYVLNEKDELVPLEKETKYLLEFIELYKFRFPDEKIKITIEGESLASNFNIPPLLFITFIENAFKHGKQGTEEDPITVVIKIENKTLFYKVENIIGNNLHKEEINGIGKYNLEKRLKLLYPNRHKITFEISNNKHIAELEIPVL